MRRLECNHFAAFIFCGQRRENWCEDSGCNVAMWRGLPNIRACLMLLRELDINALRGGCGGAECEGSDGG